MTRIIDADNTVRTICGYYCGCERDECGSDDPCEAVAFIEDAPTVSPDEVRGVGKWIIRKTAFEKEYTVCSACLTEIKIRKTSGEIVHADTRNARYCMACGAKMEVTSNE